MTGLRRLIDHLRSAVSRQLDRGAVALLRPSSGELVVDPPRRKVFVDEREVQLAKKEFVLLRVLASDPTRVFSKDELVRAVWGLSSDQTRTLDSHASRLRRKLDPDHRRFVVNCWGIGYRLVDSLEDAEPVEAGGEDR